MQGKFIFSIVLYSWVPRVLSLGKWNNKIEEKSYC